MAVGADSIAGQFQNAPFQKAPISGVRQAAGDVVEWAQDLSDEQVSALDAQLRESNLPTLTAMREATYRQALHVLSRGAIRSDEEWRLLEGYLSNADSGVLSESERSVATEIIANYEQEQ